MTLSLKKRKTVPLREHASDGNLAALVMKLLHEGLWDWSLARGRMHLNAQWNALVGYDAAALGHDPEEWFSRIHDDDVSIVKERLKAHCDAKEECFRSEHRLLHADGGYRWVLARGAAIRNRKGAPERIVGTLADIDENKRHELQLAAQLDEMRFALASEKVLMEELDRKNRELLELSITDGLTGLFNHRHLQERFDFEFKRIRRYGGALTCLLFDIDHFKAINDTCGHQYGDYIIREIASIIKTHSREVDICGRYGGEEFMVISNVDERNALRYATRLHSAIESHAFTHPTKRIRATVSIGIAEYTHEVTTKQELIEYADRAMYQAKNDGRNSIRVWRKLVADETVTAVPTVQTKNTSALRRKRRGGS
ncbi:MAG: sensor domain-containing diguanylate cyclase [Chitinispirillaceae bacterium]|nr:sensor domain-containing diguanylate cyclase [Chitinispirillaceae bacterium]